MENRKVYLLISIVFALFFIGCGKKKKDANKQTLAFADISAEGNIVSADSQGAIPILEEGMETYLDDDSISEFAFLDEDIDSNQVLFDDAQAKEDEALSLAMESLEDLGAEEFFEEEDFDVVWAEEEQKTDFQTVYFDLNKNEIRKDQTEKVYKNVDSAKVIVEKGDKIVIGGHGCQLGSPSYNLVLSERRAQVIKKEMVKKGVPEENIKTIGYGQEMPIVWTDKTDRDAVIKELSANRRAEIFATGS